MMYNIKQKGDFLLDKYHCSSLSKVQQSSITLECNTLIVFVRPLSINKSAEDAIKIGHPETNVRENDIVLILFALFVL